jgi:hypothetical protein
MRRASAASEGSSGATTSSRSGRAGSGRSGAAAGATAGAASAPPAAGGEGLPPAAAAAAAAAEEESARAARSAAAAAAGVAAWAAASASAPGSGPHARMVAPGEEAGARCAPSARSQGALRAGRRQNGARAVQLDSSIRGINVWVQPGPFTRLAPIQSTRNRLLHPHPAPPRRPHDQRRTRMTFPSMAQQQRSDWSRPVLSLRGVVALAAAFGVAAWALRGARRRAAARSSAADPGVPPAPPCDPCRRPPAPRARRPHLRVAAAGGGRAARARALARAAPRRRLPGSAPCEEHRRVGGAAGAGARPAWPAWRRHAWGRRGGGGTHGQAHGTRRA